MRIDKYLCQSVDLTRSEAKKWLHRGKVLINGEVVTNSGTKVKEGDEVIWRGEVVSPVGTRYLMLHKPQGFECTHAPEFYPSVLELLDVVRADQLKIAGRLDVDTTGLLLLSDDGQWCHKVTSPNKAQGKTYLVSLADPISEQDIEQLENGILLKGESKPTKAAEVSVVDEHTIYLTLTEGKYHQVKRMAAAIGNKVDELHRVKVGSLALNDDLGPGEWRSLTEEEIKSI